MNETDPTADGRGRRVRPASGARRPRGRHRRRWTTLGLALGVPGVLGPYLLFVQADSNAASVDPDAYYTLVSVRSDKALDVPGADTSDGAWARQMNPAAGAVSQQWWLRLAGDGYYELENHGSHKVYGRGVVCGDPS
ncbi:RICIN domain-containing protein [Kitasatospora sp. NPDC056531]|uniref:RICIN domain-containing protein n=1 Tax=Kitasatospora sp. NPDC056531 TaxID=3345856 RepID=UPI0036CA93BE